MRRRILTLVAATSLALAMAPPALAAPDERVTVDNAVGSYVRYDGGSDETLERRRGAQINAKGIYRDPVRSSRSPMVKAR